MEIIVQIIGGVFCLILVYYWVTILGTLLLDLIMGDDDEIKR